MKYFLHDTNSFQDERVAKLIMKYGFEGVGLYFLILERLAFHEKPIETKVLKKMVNADKSHRLMWKYMVEVGLLEEQDGKTFNDSVLDVAEKYHSKKEKTRKRVAEWRAAKGKEEEVTRNETVSNAAKEKEIKENKNNYNYFVEEQQQEEIVENKGMDATTGDPYFILTQRKDKALRDPAFVKEFISRGLDVFALAGWLDAFHRWLVFSNDTAKSERGYRSHFTSWIAKRSYKTMKPTEYSPVNEGKAGRQDPPPSPRLPTAAEILARREARDAKGMPPL